MEISIVIPFLSWCKSTSSSMSNWSPLTDTTLWPIFLIINVGYSFFWWQIRISAFSCFQKFNGYKIWIQFKSHFNKKSYLIKQMNYWTVNKENLPWRRWILLALISLAKSQSDSFPRPMMTCRFKLNYNLYGIKSVYQGLKYSPLIGPRVFHNV